MWADLTVTTKVLIITFGIVLPVLVAVTLGLVFGLKNHSDGKASPSPSFVMPIPIIPIAPTNPYGTLIVTKASDDNDNDLNVLSTDAGTTFHPGDKIQLRYNPSNQGFSDLGTFAISSGNGDFLDLPHNGTNSLIWTVPDNFWVESLTFKVYDQNEKSKEIVTPSHYEVLPVFDLETPPNQTMYIGQNYQIVMSTDLTMSALTKSDTWTLNIGNSKVPLDTNPTLTGNLLTFSFTPTLAANNATWTLESDVLEIQPFTTLKISGPTPVSVKPALECGGGEDFKVCNFLITGQNSGSTSLFVPGETVNISIQFINATLNSSNITWAWNTFGPDQTLAFVPTFVNVNNSTGQNPANITATTMIPEQILPLYLSLTVTVESKKYTFSAPSPVNVQTNFQVTLPDNMIIYDRNALVPSLGQSQVKAVISAPLANYTFDSIEVLDETGATYGTGFSNGTFTWYLDPVKLGLSSVNRTKTVSIQFNLYYNWTKMVDGKPVQEQALSTATGTTTLTWTPWAPLLFNLHNQNGQTMYWVPAGENDYGGFNRGRSVVMGSGGGRSIANIFYWPKNNYFVLWDQEKPPQSPYTDLLVFWTFDPDLTYFIGPNQSPPVANVNRSFIAPAQLPGYTGTFKIGTENGWCMSGKSGSSVYQNTSGGCDAWTYVKPT